MTLSTLTPAPIDAAITSFYAADSLARDHESDRDNFEGAVEANPHVADAAWHRSAAFRKWDEVARLAKTAPAASPVPVCEKCGEFRPAHSRLLWKRHNPRDRTRAEDAKIANLRHLLGGRKSNEITFARFVDFTGTSDDRARSMFRRGAWNDRGRPAATWNAYYRAALLAGISITVKGSGVTGWLVLAPMSPEEADLATTAASQAASLYLSEAEDRRERRRIARRSRATEKAEAAARLAADIALVDAELAVLAAEEFAAAAWRRFAADDLPAVGGPEDVED